MFDQLKISGQKQSQVVAQTKAPAEKAPRTVRKASPDAKAPQAQTAIRFAISKLKRPQRGDALKAHTEAFLFLSGMILGNPVPRAQCVAIIGDTAVNYHLGKDNFVQTADGIGLTESGLAFFAARKGRPDLLEGYMAAMQDGAMSDACGISSPAHLKAL